MPAFLALGRLRQEDYEFEGSLGYIASFSIKQSKTTNAQSGPNFKCI
jgi:hypothetical protein